MAAYQFIATDTVAVMKTSLESMKKEIDAMKKDKKADKKKIAQLEKEYDLKCQNMGAKILTDMQIARAGCNTMTLQIETYLGEAMKGIKTAKDALAAYNKTRDRTQLTTMEHAPVYVKTLNDLSKKEMDDFAISWNKFREFNAGIDPKYTKDANALRNQIMELTKTTRVKVNKIESMIGEAAAVKAAADSASSMVLATNEDKLAEVQELLKRLQEMTKPLAGGKETVDAVQNNAENFSTAVKAPIAELKNKIKALETQYSFNVKSVQSFTSTISSMQKVLATGKSTVEPMYLKDSKIVAALKQADDFVAHWAAEVKKAQTAVVGMAKDLKTAQDRVKAGK